MTHLLFVIDPLSSQCKPFHFVIETLRMDYPDRFDYALVVGGEADSVCRAIITVRALWGENAAFNYLTNLQRAFYHEGKDITQLAALRDVIKPEKQSEFLDFYRSERAERLMQHDFSKARSMGANTFPSVVKIDNDGHMVCQKGYQGVKAILKL